MVNGHAMIEHMLEHAAAALEVDVLGLRLANLMTADSPVIMPPGVLGEECPIQGMVDELKTTGEYESRLQAVTEFNQVDRTIGLCLS